MKVRTNVEVRARFSEFYHGYVMRNCYPGVQEATEGCFPHPRIAIALLIGESGMIFGKLCKI